MFDVLITGGTSSGRHWKAGVPGRPRHRGREDRGHRRPVAGAGAPLHRRDGTRRLAGVHRHPRPLRRRAPDRRTAPAGPPAGSDHGDPGTGRSVLRSRVAGELPDVQPLPLRHTRQGARRPRHELRRGLQGQLPPQDRHQRRHQHRARRSPRRGLWHVRRSDGGRSARTRQAPRVGGDGAGRRRPRHRHVLPSAGVERHARADRTVQDRRRVRRCLHHPPPRREPRPRFRRGRSARRRWRSVDAPA